jgi:hypothetical protein
MNYRRNAAAASLLLGLLFGGSAEAMVVKCRPTADSIPIRNTTPLLVVDGQVKGDVPAPGPDSTAIGGIKRDEILGFYVICLQITEAGVRVRRGAVSVITRAGAVQFMKSQLQGLVDQQEEYRARTGEYARNLSSLEYVETRAPLVINMQGNGGGWTANVSLAGVPTGCAVSVRRAVTGRAAPAVICT